MDVSNKVIEKERTLKKGKEIKENFLNNKEKMVTTKLEHRINKSCDVFPY